MPRAFAFRSLAPLALTAVLAAACDSPTDVDEPRLRAPQAPTASVTSEPSAPPVSTVTPIEGGGFRFTSVATLDVPVGAAWAIVHNIEKDVQIALPGIASDFQWLDGGSPGKVPSLYQFSALGTTILEEVFYMSHADHVLKYRLVTPALGILSYVGTISIEPIDETHSQLTFSRDVVFADPASVDGFAALFHQEATALQAYFNERGG